MPSPRKQVVQKLSNRPCNWREHHHEAPDRVGEEGTDGQAMAGADGLGQDLSKDENGRDRDENGTDGIDELLGWKRSRWCIF